jgi:hypothetical protein
MFSPMIVMEGELVSLALLNEETNVQECDATAAS